MDDLLAANPVAKIKTGDMVEGVVTQVRKHEMWVDMGPNGIGVIYRREGGGGAIKEGDTIEASVIEP